MTRIGMIGRVVAVAGLTVAGLTVAVAGAASAQQIPLKYHHFSVVINRRRKLAFFTACIIDGERSKSIGRTSRIVSDH